MLEHVAVARAGADRVDILERGKEGGIGQLEQRVGIVHGEGVAHGLKRLPELSLDQFDLLMREAELRFHQPVLGAHLGDLGTGFMDLVAEGAGVLAELAVGGKKLCLLEFEQALCREPRAAFLRQSCRETHAWAAS